MKTTLIVLIFFSYTLKADWVYVSYGANIEYANKFEIIGNNLVVGTSSRGLFISKNMGTSWSQSSMNNTSIMALSELNNMLFAGTYGSIQGVFVSLDSGNSWTPNNLNNLKIGCLEVFDGTIFAGAYFPYLGIYTSSNGGLNWIQNSLNNRSVFSLCRVNGTMYAGTASYGIYKSTDNCLTWMQTSLNNKIITSIVEKGNLLFAGAANDYGVYVSSDQGNTWTQTSLNNKQVHKLLVISDYIIAGTSPAGVYVSGDNGINWIQMNLGLAGGLIVHDLIEFNGFIYSASNNGIYRRTIGELTGLSNLSANLPGGFSLSQNYPNPFNPTTNIKFAISKAGFVKLIIFDVLGREIETLINENLNAGTYNTEWNAVKYSSGVFLYKLQAGEFSDIKKMILVK